MRKKHINYVVLIFVLVSGSWLSTGCFGQEVDSSLDRASTEIYAIQVAASRDFIDPDFFKQKFNITSDVRYFKRNGWFKYIIGSYSTEKEATDSLTGLKFDAFVTSVAENEIVGPVPAQPTLNRSPESKLLPADSASADSPGIFQDPYSVQMDSAELRQLYNRKIREADSAFNIARELGLARELYAVASTLAPEKYYPRDQIVEIDKLLMQKEEQTLISKLPLQVYVIAAFALLVLLGLSIFLIIRMFRRKRRSGGSNSEIVSRDSVSDFAFEEHIPSSFPAPETDHVRNIKILQGEILPLYGHLAGELSGLDPANFQKLYARIRTLLNSSRIILRMEAELALIRLDPSDPFSFLDDLEVEFTPWEQLHVYEMVRRNAVLLPDFSRWHDSPNESVVLFCERMTQAFRKGHDIQRNAHHETEGSEIADKRGIENLIGQPDGDLQRVALEILIRKINIEGGRQQSC